MNAVRAFEAAGRHESFSRAADELGVSHSAISKHVRGLEDRLGAQLFRDLPRGVALTAQGARYLAELSPAFDAIAEATAEFSDRPSGVVRVNSETVFAAKWLVHNLHDFYARHPGVEIELDATPDLVDITRYEAEVAIRFFLNEPEDQETTLLSNAPIYPHATPEIAAEIGGDPLKLLNYRLLRDRAGDPWTHWFALAGYPDAPLPKYAPKRIRALLANEAVTSGLGVLLASEDNVATDLKSGRVVRVFDTGFRQGSYHLLFGDGVLRRKPVRIFRDWLLEKTEGFRGAPL